MPKLLDDVGLFPLFPCQESIFGIMHKIDYRECGLRRNICKWSGWTGITSE